MWGGRGFESPSCIADCAQGEHGTYGRIRTTAARVAVEFVAEQYKRHTLNRHCDHYAACTRDSDVAVKCRECAPYTLPIHLRSLLYRYDTRTTFVLPSSLSVLNTYTAPLARPLQFVLPLPLHS